MNIHEHQAKSVLSEFGVAVPRGYAAFSPDEAVKAAQDLGGPVFVVKSQIHAGGRGKGRFEGLGPDSKGGVRVVKSVDEVKANAEEMLGRVLVTHQTGPKGKQVNRLYIEEGAAIAKEFYLSLLVDRETSRVSVVASTEGGMDIEEVAHSTPEKIVTFSIDPATGVFPHHARALSKALGLTGGLAMGTMDIVNLHGGKPANFLDVGGGATKERVTEAFKIILSDSNVAAVLVNIFGGIVRCDMIAEGIIGAVKEVGVKVPVVVRLEGNNAELGAKVLAESGLNIIAATSLTDAAQQVVKAAEGK